MRSFWASNSASSKMPWAFSSPSSLSWASFGVHVRPGRRSRRRRRGRRGRCLVGLLLVLLLFLLGPPAGLTPRDPVGDRGRRTSDDGGPGHSSKKSWHCSLPALSSQTAESAASSASAAANSAWTGIRPLATS